MRKPVLNVMGLLARLGDRIYDGPSTGPLPASVATLGMLATSRGFHVAADSDSNAESASTTAGAELAALVYVRTVLTR